MATTNTFQALPTTASSADLAAEQISDFSIQPGAWKEVLDSLADIAAEKLPDLKLPSLTDNQASGLKSAAVIIASLAAAGITFLVTRNGYSVSLALKGCSLVLKPLRL